MATLISQEPLFYGDFPYRRGTSAEDFIARVNNWATANEWDAAVKTANAINFLRDDASHFFKNVLLCKSEADHAAINAGDWDVFERVFRAKYYAIRSTMDLSSDWTLLKQGPKETACNFAGRVGGLLVQYCNLLPDAPLTDDEWTRMRTVLDPTWGNAAATLNEIRAVRALMVTMWTERRKTQQRVAYYDLGYKILTSGLRHNGLIAKVRAQERLNTPFGEILDFLEKEEANMGGSVRPADNAPHKTLIPTVGTAVAAVAGADADDGDDAYQDEVAALNAQLAALNAKFGNKGAAKAKPNNNRRRGKGKGPAQTAAGTSGSGTASTKQPPRPITGADGKQYVKDFSKVGYGLPCNICKQVGHWQRDCPDTQAFADFKASRAGVHATQDTRVSSVDQRYQQFLAREAQFYGGQVNSVATVTDDGRILGGAPRDFRRDFQRFLAMDAPTFGGPVNAVNSPGFEQRFKRHLRYEEEAFRGPAYEAMGSGNATARM